MTVHDSPGKPQPPPPKKLPEIIPPADPEEPAVIPGDDPDIIPDDDPYENPPYEMPEPGEGP